MKRDSLVRLMRDPQRELFEIIAGITTDQAEKIRVTGRWSLRDTVAHLVSWAEEIEREVHHIVEAGGGNLPWTISSRDNYSEWNQAHIGELGNVSYSELLERLELINRRTEEFIISLSTEQLSLVAGIPWYYPPRLTVSEIISVKSFHEISHLKRVSSSIKKGRENIGR